MKKLFRIVLSLLFALSLAACTGSPEETIREDAESFLSALESGDYIKAHDFTVEDADQKLNDLVGSFGSVSQALSESGIKLSVDAEQKLNQLIQLILDKAMKNHVITEITEEDNIYTVHGEIDVIDTESLKNAIKSIDYEQAFGDKKDQLAQLLQAADQQKALSEIMNMVFSYISTDLDNIMSTIKFNKKPVTLKFEKTEDHYRITDIGS